MRKTPVTVGVLPESQVLQMVPDVFTRGDFFAAASHSKPCLFSLFEPNEGDFVAPTRKVCSIH
jgi:hypothetical protein